MAHEAPEVIHSAGPVPDDGLEVSSSGASLTRSSSLLQPEPFNPGPYFPYQQQLSPPPQQYGTYYSDAENNVPVYDNFSRPSYAATSRGESEAAALQDGEKQVKPTQRRCCGLRRRTFIIIVIVAVLICIGVILGAVLGTVLSKSSSKNPIPTTKKTGLASVVVGNTMYSYFQDPDGKILENSYSDEHWSLQNEGNTDDALVTGDAGIGTPMAAIAYPYKGKSYRQVFYFDSAGHVRTVNRTSNGQWSASEQISGNTAYSSGIGLAACWGDEKLNGFRVYYPNQYNYWQELGKDFGADSWEEYQQFDGFDITSGVACAVHKQPGHEFLNVYLRKGDSAQVVQNWYDFLSSDPSWQETGPTTPNDKPVAAGSDVAVASDATDTEYVFYQQPGGMITMAVTNPIGAYFQAVTDQHPAGQNSKLAASYFQGGAAVFFQKPSSSTGIWVSDVSRNGASIFDMPVT